MRNTNFFIAIISCVVLVNFSNNISNDYSLDDNFYVQQLTDIQSISDLPKILYKQFSIADYRPGASLSFAIEKLMFETSNPHVSHFVNLLLYILCVILFYRILKSFTSNIYIIQISTLLFAILPLHTSMIANIKNRDGLLSFILGSLALLFLIKIKSKKSIPQRLLYLGLSTLLIIAATFCKLDALMFLLILPLLFIINSESIDIRFFLRTGIVFIISYRLITVLYSVWMGSRNALLSKKIEVENLSDELLFTENPLAIYNQLDEKLSFTIQTLFEYLIMMFKPFHHFFYYGYDVIPLLPLSHPVIITKAIVLILIGLSAIYFIKTKPLYSFGVLSMFISLSYCSNLYQPVAGIVADRYAFIASMGACIAAGSLLYELFVYLRKKYSLKIDESRSQLLIMTLIILIYTPFNIVRGKDWKNMITIIEADIPYLKEKSYEANRIAMSTYIEEGFDTQNPNEKAEYLVKALEHGETAIKIYDKYFLPHEGVALAYFGLGHIDKAKIKALENIAIFDTTLETTYRILADIYSLSNQNDSLAWIYKKILEIHPDDDYTILKTAEYLYKDNQKDEALMLCDSIIQTQPTRGGAYQAKAYIYFDLKDSLNGALNSEKAFELGIRDNILLDASGYYWWPKDKAKYESLKKYVN